MKTLYAACLSRLGLSRTEAAALHGVRPDTIHSWSCGRNPVPQGAWDDLRAYEAQLIDASEDLREQWKAVGKPTIEINDSDASTKTLMVAADFVLTSNGPMKVGKTAATDRARAVRKMFER